MKKKFIYSFKHGVAMREARDLLFLAALATESVFGRSLFRLEANFLMDADRNTCCIDASTPVGRVLACIFHGFVSKQIGERRFRIQRTVGSYGKEGI